jgi:hypothetical protein
MNTQPRYVDSIRAQDRSGERRTFKVGDYVDFKSDIEQCGQITHINTATGYIDRCPELTLENPDGFPGDYLRYATTTIVRCDDVWAQED